ncbi:MAG: 1-deoxy-D-xylulose-5-phosphate reductoisomerase [Sphingomonadaceae bacterium]
MSARRSITILGATGSVGGSTLDLVERNRERYEVLALTSNREVEKLARAARRTGARLAVVADESCREALDEALAGTGVETAAGKAAVLDAARMGADWTMAAIVGCAGLEPVLAALEGGKSVALANKEPLVSAGAIVLEAAAKSGATLLPVDSEHNAIFQCLEGENPERVRRIILTASGGPFRDWSLEAMRAATPEQAVAHPNWSMGAKISVDSATLMNKGLELIEAWHLFPVAKERIEILVHPQSVVHSLVEYVDGSLLSQLGPADMRVPIAHALAWPDRIETPCAPLDLARLGALDFEPPDPRRFPALELARAALEAGGASPAILNASNEVAVASFLDRRIGFLDIASIARKTLEILDLPPPRSVEDVLETDALARRRAQELIGETAA